MCIFICLCVGMNIVFTIWVNSIYHLSIVFTMACNAGEPGLIPGLGDHLEKEMATPSSILAWEIPWTGSLVGYIQSMGSQRVGHNLATHQQQHLHVKCQPHDSQTCICYTVCAQLNVGWMNEWETKTTPLGKFKSSEMKALTESPAFSKLEFNRNDNLSWTPLTLSLYQKKIKRSGILRPLP